MTSQLLTNITILVLAAFVGFEVISKVPTTLHTPLMSGTNAIHGIVIVGGLLTVGALAGGWVGTVLGTVAVIFGTMSCRYRFSPSYFADRSNNRYQVKAVTRSRSIPQFAHR